MKKGFDCIQKTVTSCVCIVGIRAGFDTIGVSRTASEYAVQQQWTVIPPFVSLTIAEKGLIDNLEPRIVPDKVKVQEVILNFLVDDYLVTECRFIQVCEW